MAEVAESTCRTGLARWIRTWTPARATHISGKVMDRVFFYMMYLLVTILGIPIPVSVTLGRDGILCGWICLLRKPLEFRTTAREPKDKAV